MYKLVVMITPLLEKAHEIAEAWQEAGAPGVTVVESYGLWQLQSARQDTEVLPGMMSMIEILRNREQTSVTLLSLVLNESTVNRLIDVAQQIAGDLNQADNGILFVINVDQAIGLRRAETP